MPKLLVFDEDAVSGRKWVRQLQGSSADPGVRFQQAATIELLQSSLDEHTADVILADVRGTKAPRIEWLTAIQRRHPGMRALVVVDLETSASEPMQRLLSSPSVDFVRAPVDVREVWQRIRRLVEAGTISRSAATGSAAISGRTERRVHRAVRTGRRSALTDTASGELTRHLAPNLRNSNGRLDAKKIATLFGVHLVDVARVIGRPLSAVHKTPDATSLQASLALFERIAVALLPLAGSAEGLRMWLNAPLPDLEGHPPLELIARGQGEIVAELLEDALVGQPG